MKFQSAVFSSLALVLSQSLALFVGSALISKSLSVDDTAVWFLFMALAPIVNFFDFGASVYVTREVPLSMVKRRFKMRIKNISVSLRRAYWGFSLLLLALAGLAMGLAVIFDYMSVKYLYPLLIFFVGCLFRLLSNLNFAFIFGLQKVNLERNLKSLLFLFYLACLSWVYLHQASLFAYVRAWFYFGLFSWILSEFVLWQVLPKEQGRFISIVLRRALSSGSKWLGNSLPALALASFQVYIVGWFWSSSDVKTLGLLQQLMQGIVTISSIPAMILGPQLSLISLSGELESCKNMVQAILKHTLFLAGVGLSFLIIFHHALFHFWVGDSMNIPNLWIWSFAAFALLESMNTSMTSMLWYLQKFEILTYTLKSAFIVMLLSFLFTPQFSLLGVFVASLLGQLSFSYRNNFFYLMLSVQETGRAFLRQSLTHLLLFFCLCLLLLGAIENLPLGPGLRFGLGILVSGIIFVVLNWKFKLKVAHELPK